MPPSAAVPVPDPEPGDVRPDSGSRLRTTIAVGIGALAVGLLLYHAGLADVWARLRNLGWAAPLVLAPYGVIALLDAIGWRRTLPTDAPVPLGTLYAVRMAGEAVSSITPAAAVGGEPVKALLLRGRGVAGADVVASLVISKTALTVSQSVFVVVGLAALFEHMELRGVGIAWIGLLVALCAGFGYGLVHLQRRGPVGTVWSWLKRVMPRARFVARLEHAVEAVDARLAEYYHLERHAFLWSSWWHMAGWLVGVAEVWLMMLLIGNPITWQDALIIEALAQPIRATAIVVPGAFGTQEIGGVAVCSFLAIPEASGVTLWLLKRGREVIFDGLGLLYLVRHTARGTRR